MTKLRNISYLRFGSKIRQGFAVATPPSPHVSPFPLNGCCLLQMQVDDLSFYIGEEPAAPLPGGRPACRPSTGR